ncbi:Zn-dependent hydrolase [Roseovarius spongiae]|uniref:Zn-dependent hydrolase n=1 Tax=Roseovarius spongiae TaxID=2320272 RepID=A0A3A8B035_9RHOB|nr:allantoate amidohydrolase [Roseovarius spongiae]RKF16740.1 Zn-dependent hydrolase [Roseovarius spongiae]
MTDQAPAPAINADRLWSRHMEMARIGPVEETGNCRLALTPEDVEARNLFARWCREAGMELTSDRAANMFARREGRDPARAAVAAGSHLDTQPHGGRFDGVSGVLTALEVIETLKDAGIETDAPLMVVNWTNEEGVRFGPGILGSAWFAGRIDDATLDDIRATDGARFAEEAAASGWRGTATPADLPMEAFFELHIEQGPMLEQAGADIGVVDAVQGLCWLDVAVTGMDAHAGTTPLPARRDALLAAAAMLVGINDMGRASGEDARVSVGRLKTATEGPSTVVGASEFVIDIRHPDQAMIAHLQEECRRVCAEVARRYGCGVEVSQRFAIPPTAFDGGCVAAVEAAAQALQLPYRRMASGALHDAANVAAHAPTSMIFVPCRDGISHNVAEYASREHLAAGANVLLRAMLAKAG